MRVRRICTILLTLSLFLTGCQEEPVLQNEEEPTATYDWMAGESPVPNQRMIGRRRGVNLEDHAVSPTGIYFIPEVQIDNGTWIGIDDATYIWYADHGSDTFTKLCGRVDCTHDNPDCNAYLYKGSDLSYYQGKLYAVIGEGYPSEECKLIRMNPDGSGHEEILDVMSFAEDQGASFAHCNIIGEGYCVIDIYGWKENEDGTRSEDHLEEYIYRLDETMEEPEIISLPGIACYYCGDMVVVGGGLPDLPTYGVDMDRNTCTFLFNQAEVPGNPFWYNWQEVYYINNGVIMRRTFATGEDECLVDTGLHGNYYVFPFPDCLVLVSQDEGNDADDNLYIYNWAYQLVSTVKLDYPLDFNRRFALIAETAQQIFLTDQMVGGYPRYYIDKAELGTGNVQLHEFKYSE